MERHVARTAGAMNWRASCLGGRSPLVFTEGNKTAPRYVDNVLDPYGLLCIQEIEDGIFQQDNARPYTYCPHYSAVS